MDEQGAWAVIWDEQDLEAVPHCPACQSADRTLRHDDLEDITFGNVAGRFSMMECTACGAGYLDPRPRPEVIGAAYRRYYTHDAGTGNHEGRTGLADRIRHMLANDYRAVRYGARTGARLPLGAQLLNRLPRHRSVMDAYYRYLPREHGRLLDFGCGNGAFLKLARDEIGWDVAGVDFDPNAVRAASLDGLDVRQGGPEALADWTSHFDVITLSHVLEHVHHPRALMEGVFAALKPGGMVFAETPNITAQCHAVFGRHWRGLEAPRHLMIPSWRAMEQLLTAPGFIGLTRHPRTNLFTSMYQVSAALRAGEGSEDPASQERPDPPAGMMAAAQARSELCEYVTMTARKPL